MEDSQEIFDILSWTEDISLGVTTKRDYSHNILNLLVKDIETIDGDFTSSGDNNGITASDNSANGGVLQQDSSSEEHKEVSKRELEEVLKEVLLSGCEFLQVPSVVQYFIGEEDKDEEEEGEIDILKRRKKKRER